MIDGLRHEHIVILIAMVGLGILVTGSLIAMFRQGKDGIYDLNGYRQPERMTAFIEHTAGLFTCHIYKNGAHHCGACGNFSQVSQFALAHCDEADIKVMPETNKEEK